MSAPLNFSKVDESRVSPPMELEATLVAVIQFHDSLPDAGNGRKTITLPTLVSSYASGCSGLLGYYVCAFGHHGEAVIRRYVRDKGVNEDEFNQVVERKLAAIRADYA